MKTKINVFLSFGSQSDRNYCYQSFYFPTASGAGQYRFERLLLLPDFWFFWSFDFYTLSRFQDKYL